MPPKSTVPGTSQNAADIPVTSQLRTPCITLATKKANAAVPAPHRAPSRREPPQWRNNSPAHSAADPAAETTIPAACMGDQIPNNRKEANSPPAKITKKHIAATAKINAAIANAPIALMQSDLSEVFTSEAA
jgi:hypothetical protein